MIRLIKVHKSLVNGIFVCGSEQHAALICMLGYKRNIVFKGTLKLQLHL